MLYQFLLTKKHKNQAAKRTILVLLCLAPWAPGSVRNCLKVNWSARKPSSRSKPMREKRTTEKLPKGVSQSAEINNKKGPVQCQSYYSWRPHILILFMKADRREGSFPHLILWSVKARPELCIREWLYSRERCCIRITVKYSLSTSWGRSPRDFPRAQAIFHTISFLKMEYWDLTLSILPPSKGYISQYTP